VSFIFLVISFLPQGSQRHKERWQQCAFGLI
jgi:hypothetical protein